MNENRLLIGIITKITTELDNLGVPSYTLYAKTFSTGTSMTVGSEFIVKPLSIMPTDPIGSKAVSLPTQGQKVVLMRTPNDPVVYIIGYIESGAKSNGMYEREVEPGEYKLIIQGIRPTELSIKPGEVYLDAGGYNNLTVSQKTESVIVQSARYQRMFHGGFEENQFIKNSKITATTGAWTAYKESNSFSDKFNIETEEPRVPVYNSTMPAYTDKVVERKGAILDYSSGGTKLKHVYQLETRQDVGDTGTKNTFSVLRLGYQDNMAGNLPDSKGFIIDWSTKRLLTDTSAVTSLLKIGKNEDSELYRQQFVDGVQIISNSITDPAGRDQGYESVDISLDNATSIDDFWYAKSIKSSDSDYFYRSGLGSTKFLHHYDEISKTSFMKTVSSRKDGTKNEFQTELKQDSYTLNLTTDKNAYTMSMSGGSIVLDYNKVSTITMMDKDISIKVKDDGKIHIANNTDNLKAILSDLIDAINTMTLKHPQGPTLPMPINFEKFNTIKINIQNLLGG